MATHAEQKVFFWIASIAVLGAGVRVWRTYHPANISDFNDDSDAVYHLPSQGKHDATSSSHSSNHHSRRTTTARPVIDSTSVIDLDHANLAQIESLGVLKAGGPRVIIANRDSFGPFGSMDEVARISYLTKPELRKLARRVTFSTLPRPKNAVMPRYAAPN